MNTLGDGEEAVIKNSLWPSARWLNVGWYWGKLSAAKQGAQLPNSYTHLLCINKRDGL